MATVYSDVAVDESGGREALWFYVIACAISWVIWTPLMLEGLGVTDWLEPYDPEWFYKLAYARPLNDIDWLSVSGGLGPILAAVLVTWRFRGGAAVRALFVRALPGNTGWHWYLIAFSLPLAYHSLAGLIEAALGQPFPLGNRGAGAMTIPAFLYSVATMTVFIIVEELGWRGVMQPALQRSQSALKAAVIVGLAWGYWHLPFYINLFFLGSGSALEAALQVALVPVLTIPFSILLGWLLNSTSGSVFVCMLMHAANNSAYRLFHHSGNALLWIAIGMWLLALLVVFGFGARTLSRKPRFVLA
jgi:membrane protease YdiL (CAAX protease family)